MSVYSEFAETHFGTLAYQPPPLDNFWDLIEELRWPEGGPDAFAERVCERLSLPDALRFERQINDLGDELEAATQRAFAESGDTPQSAFWLQDLWDAFRHVVGLGRSTYDEFMREPKRIMDIEPEFGLGYIVDAATLVYEATPEELEHALRIGSVVRPFEDPSGHRNGELIEHPEHGLGFLSVDPTTPWLWIVFPNETLSTQRHRSPARWVALYREADYNGLDLFYAGLGPGEHADIFVREAPVGQRRGGHVILASDNAAEQFDALVEAAREAGYGSVEPATSPLTIRIDDYGLDAPDVIEFYERLDRLFRETGLGEANGLRQGAEQSEFHARVVAPERAAAALDVLWNEEPPSFAVFDDREDPPSLLGGDEDLERELPTPPCDVHESLAYFSRLSITPHPDTLQWAVAAAANVSLSGLDELDDHLAELREARAAGELDDDELDRISEQLGAFVGETIRQEVGGEWGVGTLFTERIWYGLLLGDAQIRWWPVREVRQQIEGHQRSFEERCIELKERSAQPKVPPADRLFTLASGQGYFDVGVTSDGRQALMGAFYDGPIAFFFDADGLLLEYATRQGELEAWQQELGFEARDIAVRRFSSRAAAVGIEDLPSHFEEFLEDPGGFDDEDREHYPTEIERWVSDGDFVLYWGNDLWLDASGNVTST